MCFFECITQKNDMHIFYIYIYIYTTTIFPLHPHSGWLYATFVVGLTHIGSMYFKTL